MTIYDWHGHGVAHCFTVAEYDRRLSEFARPWGRLHRLWLRLRR